MIAEQIFLTSAKDFAREAAKHLQKLDGVSQRHVYFVSSAIISEFRLKQQTPKAIKGSRAIHAIKSKKLGRLSHTTASCFCGVCRTGSGPCPYGVPPMSKVILFRGIYSAALLDALLACFIPRICCRLAMPISPVELFCRAYRIAIHGVLSL